MRHGRLGFGCAALSLADPPEHHAEVLATVWEAGVRWFDVARSYSYGTAEATLGRFVRGRRDDAVLVTKFGISPPSGLARSARLQPVARALFSLAPGLKRHVTGRIDRGASAGDFSVAAATRSLEASLRSLGTDRVDALLLHEIVPAALHDDLREWLEDQRRRGTVVNWGTATPGTDETAAVLRDHPWAADPVAQVHDPVDSPLPAELLRPGLLIVTHSVMQRRLPRLRATLAARPALAREVHDATGLDLEDGASLGQVLLSDASARHPSGVVLFASRDVARCWASARALEDVPPETARAALAMVERQQH